jgi:predicted Zn-dependent peptidase
VPTATPKPRTPAVWGQGERYVANVRPISADEEQQVDLLLAFPGLPASDEDRTCLSVMTHVLGVGMSSRLFHTVREREGLAYRISAGHEPFDDTGLFSISTATRPNDAARAVQLSVREFRRMAEERVPEDELEAAKASMIGRLLRGTETAGASSHWYASRWRAGLAMETPDSRSQAIAAVNAEQVQRVASRIVDHIGDVRLAFVGPREQGAELLEAAAT